MVRKGLNQKEREREERQNGYNRERVKRTRMNKLIQPTAISVVK